MVNLVNLYRLVELKDDVEISEKYVRYLVNMDNENKYRHNEIVYINQLLNYLDLSIEDADSFFYSYNIPQLNKEMDLIKICNDLCINIEIKSGNVTKEKIARQLVQNNHYLKMLNREVICVTYIADSNEIYLLNKNELIDIISKGDLIQILKDRKGEYVNLDEVFSPKNILVSPLNDTDKFINGNYLLTEYQEMIKNSILLIDRKTTSFVGITGNAGTGKTLLTYDIAKHMSKYSKVLIIHGGNLCDGHKYLDKKLSNIDIYSAKYFRYKKIIGYDLIVLDEAHRIYTTLINKVIEYIEESNCMCLFCYDEKQTLSKSEIRRDSVKIIKEKVGDKLYKLTNKIRTNKEINNFIYCLQDLNRYKEDYVFNNVKLIYIGNKIKANEYAKYICEVDGYIYITFTSSFYDSNIDYQYSDINTHSVIGQEFEKVCMLLDDNFMYIDGRLTAKTHPNPDYLFEKLLYQGLTRTRSKLLLIVTTKNLLENIFKLLKH